MPPRFVAHRFGRTYGPDSSRAALERALTAPVAGFETDCCLTADGRIVLLHDELLSRSTDGEGWAQDRTADELAALHLRRSDGTLSDEHPLSLEEGLELLAPHDGIVQLEVKAFADAALAARTAEIVCDRALEGPVPRERLEVISFWPVAAEVAARRGLRARVIVACPYTPRSLADWGTQVGLHGVILEAHYWSEEHVGTWRAAGLSVMSGVVNDAEHLRRVLAFAPDFVASDRPHELAAEL